MNKTHKTKPLSGEEAIRKYYARKIREMVGKNYSWTKLDKEIKYSKNPQKQVRWIVVALFWLPLKMFYRYYLSLWENLQQNYPEELCLWMPEKRIRKTIGQIDPYVESILEWTAEEVIPGYTVADYIKDLSEVWDIAYDIKYFIREVEEMKENRDQGGELTSFTKIKRRKSKEKTRGEQNF